jgi:hypothetical protein
VVCWYILQVGALSHSFNDTHPHTHTHTHTHTVSTSTKHLLVTRPGSSPPSRLVRSEIKDFLSLRGGRILFDLRKTRCASRSPNGRETAKREHPQERRGHQERAPTRKKRPPRDTPATANTVAKNFLVVESTVWVPTPKMCATSRAGTS